MKNKIAALTMVIMILSLLPVNAAIDPNDPYYTDLDDPNYFTTVNTRWTASSYYIQDPITLAYSEYFDYIEQLGYGRLHPERIDYINNNSFDYVVVIEMPWLEYDENTQTYIRRRDNHTNIIILTSDYPFEVRLDTLKQIATENDWYVIRFKGTDLNQTIRAHQLLYEEGRTLTYLRTEDALFVPLTYRVIDYWDKTNNIQYALKGRGINRWATYIEKNSVPNDPDQQDDNQYIYVTSTTGYYIDPQIFHDIDFAQTVLTQLQWHSKGYGRVAAYVHTRAGPFLLRAQNYDQYDVEKVESLILPLAVNRQHFNNHSYFDIDIYVWTPDAVEFDDPFTAQPEGYTDKLQTIRVFFTQPPKTCPDGYNCDDPDPNKWVPIDGDRSSDSGLLKPKIPQKPDNNWDIIGWIMYIIDWIIYIVESIVYVLARIGELIVQFFSGATGFINILSAYFNFLPREIVSVIVLGILTSLLAALLRR